MPPKYPSRNPVLRRAVLERFNELRQQATKKEAMAKAVRAAGKKEKKLLKMMRRYQRLKGDHLTLREAVQIQRHRDIAQIMQESAATAGVKLSPKEAARAIDVYYRCYDMLHPNLQKKFSWIDFNHFYLDQRKKSGKPLGPNGLKRVIQQMEKGSGADFFMPFLGAEGMGTRMPHSTSLLGPRVYDMHARARKEQRLNDESLQRQVLRSELSHRIGAQTNIADAAILSPKEIRGDVMAIVHGEFSDSLRRAASSVVKGWGALPESKRNDILRGRAMRALGEKLFRLFAPHQKAIEKRKTTDSPSNWVINMLRNPMNRLYLAELAMKWYGPKTKKK